jgi:hypothetical protein
MSERKPRIPKLTRKYQETDDTYDTSSVLQYKRQQPVMSNAVFIGPYKKK